MRSFSALLLCLGALVAPGSFAAECATVPDASRIVVAGGSLTEILYDLGELSQLRPDEADLKAIPLKELRTFGFETLMDKAMKANLSAVLDSSETMVAYERELEEEGII